MRLGYYQIFWQHCETFEYRYNIEVEALLKAGIIKSYTLVEEYALIKNLRKS